MPHGAPDWVWYKVKAITHPVQDLAELAARLGSPVVFDRRGDVFLIDGFENGLVLGAFNYSGLGGSYSINTTRAKTGSQSLALTAGSDAEHRAWGTWWRGMQAAPSLGFEASIAPGQDAGLFTMRVSGNTGKRNYDSAIYIDLATDTLYYMRSDGSMATLATGINITPVDYVWSTLKYVIDLSTGEYKRAIVNAFVVDMTGIKFFYEWTPAPSLVMPEVIFTGRVGYNDRINIDDVILTINEE